MKTALLTVAAIAAMLITARSEDKPRFRETIDEACVRYGPPISAAPDKSRAVFFKSGWTITMEFLKEGPGYHMIYEAPCPKVRDEAWREAIMLIVGLNGEYQKDPFASDSWIYKHERANASAKVVDGKTRKDPKIQRIEIRDVAALDAIAASEKDGKVDQKKLQANKRVQGL